MCKTESVGGPSSAACLSECSTCSAIPLNERACRSTSHAKYLCSNQMLFAAGTCLTQGLATYQGLSERHWQCTIPKVLFIAGCMPPPPRHVREKSPLFIFCCCISLCAFLLKPLFVMVSSCCPTKRNCQVI